MIVQLPQFYLKSHICQVCYSNSVCLLKLTRRINWLFSCHPYDHSLDLIWDVSLQSVREFCSISTVNYLEKQGILHTRQKSFIICVIKELLKLAMIRQSIFHVYWTLLETRAYGINRLAELQGFIFKIHIRVHAADKLFKIILDFCGTTVAAPLVIRNIHRMVWRSKAGADFFLAQTVNSCSLSMCHVIISHILSY